MSINRYDKIEIKATKTDEGYLVDTPVVGRIGIQVYKSADGSLRKEFRPPEEVFNIDSLSTYAGKPITDEHPSQPVDSKNAKKVIVGVMKEAGKQDGDNVIAPITIYDSEMVDKILNGGKRELSLGYKVDLDETPGEWNGEHYDAIQRNIRINHLAIVPRGRAGNARLNLDRYDAVSFNDDNEESEMGDNFVTVRLDNGLEYKCSPEVSVAIEKLRKDGLDLNVKVNELTKQVDTISAERDTFKAQVQSAEQVKADALDQARAEVKARTELEKVAETFKVDCAGKTDREVKELVIKSSRADADLTGKSNDYIDAAFDLAVSMRKDDAMANQRLAGQRSDNLTKMSGGTYKNFMSNLGNKEQK